MRHLIRMVVFLLVLSACQQTPQTNFKPLDLLSHGVPLTIQAPENAVVKTKDMTVMKDITVIKDPEYNIQIYTSAANTTDFNAIKNEHLEDVKNNPYFTKLIEESPNGFIYEKQVDSTNISYGFKYVHIQGDQEYIFQNGYLGIFTLEDIKNMYNAVKQQQQK